MSDTAVLPNHIGLILDGNRRWAKQKGLPTLEGHERGAEVLREIALYAFEKGIKYGTAFIFSTENWQRTKEEVSYLMKLMIKVMERYLKSFGEKGIKIVVLGRRADLSKDVLKAIDRAEEQTRNNTKGTLGLCFNYGGQEEIVDAFKQLVVSGISPKEITKEVVASVLYKPEIPPIDLLVRTGGEFRTSGFMMYRADYAELYFSEKLWPDFTTQDLDQALVSYAARQRRFGT